MTIAVRQDINSALGTASKAITVLTGSYLIAVATNPGVAPSAVTDGTNTYTQRGSTQHDATNGWFLNLWTTGPVSAGTYTVAQNQSADPGIWLVEITGSSGPLTSNVNGNVQGSPGTGTGGVTTGVLGTLASAPALIWGIGFNDAGATPTADTGAGWTSSATGWNNPNATSEYQRVIATTSIAALFTAASGQGSNPHLSLAIAFAESIGVVQRKTLSVIGTGVGSRKLQI